MADCLFAIPVPQLSKLTPENLRKALEIGHQEKLIQFQEIVQSDEIPNVSILHQLDNSSNLYRRAIHALWSLAATDGTPDILAMETEWKVRESKLDSLFLQDPRLHRKISQIPDNSLSNEEKDLKQWFCVRMRKAGALLDEKTRNEVAALDADIAELSSNFGQAALKISKDVAPCFSREELEGLGAIALNGAAEAARSAGVEGYVIPISQFTAQPALSTLKNPESRKKLFRASVSRADPEQETWNYIKRIISLRATKAKALGFTSYAAWAVSDRLAEKPEKVEELLKKVVPFVVEAARKEIEKIKETIKLCKRGETYEITAADIPFYAAQTDEQNQLSEYFEITQVTKGILFAAKSLYGIEFEKLSEGPCPESEAYRVFAGQQTIGYVTLDYFERRTKRGGAWMNFLVEQSVREHPVVQNNASIVKPQPGDPCLLSLDEVITLFHEFGHALHGLLSNVEFREFSGTNCKADWVEVPSQVNEMWATHKVCLETYAKHFKTGEQLTEDQIAAITGRKKRDAIFLHSFFQSLVIDWEWHSLESGTRELENAIENPSDFELRALKRWGLQCDLILPRYRSAYFLHIFQDSGYAAGYWTYLWADVFATSLSRWFTNNGGLTRENGEKYKIHILAKGGSGDPNQHFRDLTGCDPQIEDYLEANGLMHEMENLQNKL